jgi:hypothetical protein
LALSTHTSRSIFYKAVVQRNQLLDERGEHGERREIPQLNH